MTPLERVLAAFPGARRNAGGWMGHCGAHEDRTASVSLSEGRDGAVLVHDHGGCTVDAVLAAAGLSLSDLFPTTEARKIVANYPYHDADGRLLYEVVRFEPKGFAQRRPDGAGGWAWSLNGVERTLYRLPHLRAADPGRLVFIVEGERDVDRLAGLGILATTASGGAGRWQREYADALRGRRVVVLPDNDGPGRQHAQDVARSLLGVASEVRIMELPVPPKGDVSDFLDAGGTVAGLKALVRAAPLVTAEMLSAPPPRGPEGKHPLSFRTARELSAAGTPETRWLVRLLAAFGGITEVDGAPKRAGKTTFLCHLIAAVLDGRDFLDEPTTRTPIVLLSEQPWASLRAVLGRAGLLDRDDLHVMLWRDAAGSSWEAVVAAALVECERVGGALIIDTLPQFAGLRGDSENDAGAALEALRPLQAAAGDGLCVIVARHDRKGGGETGESARGSSAFTGGVDIVLRLSRKPDAVRDTIREMSALSRFDEAPAEVLIELTSAGYVVVGSEQGLARQVARSAVLDHLPADGGMTREELMARTALGKTAIGGALNDLVSEGLASRIGTGVKGDPYRFGSLPSEAVASPGIHSAAPYRAAGRNGIPETGGNDPTASPEPVDLVADALRIFGDEVLPDAELAS